ncbi:MAG: MotA/TolQ/ExbB proton channel family protein [Candidatus Magnetomorum sp.]|nr:MotA/TolQ/ExbB proton channel family protein [Candidatus Magnetomorum sp.]
MIDVIHQGGLFMYVILIVSVIAMTLFLERANFLYLRLRLNIEQAYQNIIRYLEKVNYRGAIEECVRIENHPLGRILKAGLIKSDKKDKDIELAMEESIMREIPSVRARINYLTMFANIATLLGLLGTIFGLITAFKGVGAASDTMRQEVLAQGISMAMMTTAFGLIVAIPCIAGYYVLNNRGDYIVDQLEEKALGLYNVLTIMKREKDIS